VEELLFTALELELDCLLVLEDIPGSEWGDEVMLGLWREGRIGGDCDGEEISATRGDEGNSVMGFVVRFCSELAK
jgi:hypothetical protein